MAFCRCGSPSLSVTSLMSGVFVFKPESPGSNSSSWMGRDFFKNLLNVFPDPKDSVTKMQMLKPGFAVCGHDESMWQRMKRLKKKKLFLKLSKSLASLIYILKGTNTNVKLQKQIHFLFVQISNLDKSLHENKVGKEYVSIHPLKKQRANTDDRAASIATFLSSLRVKFFIFPPRHRCSLAWFWATLGTWLLITAGEISRVVWNRLKGKQNIATLVIHSIHLNKVALFTHR